MPPISRIYKGTELVYSAPDTQPLTAFLTNLQAGDRIQLFRAANIRTAATISTTTLKGVNPSGARGTVIAGPTTGVSNSTWYNINFDLGYDGWCVSDNYTQITTTTIQTTPNTFAVNDKIRLIRASNIRSTALIATTNLLGVNPTNTKGTILEGPTKTANINWYRINFDAGFDGWCASDNYVKVAITGEGGGAGGGFTTPVIVGGVARIPANAIAQAAARPLLAFANDASGPSVDAGQAVYHAWNSWAGDTSTDAFLLQCLHNVVSKAGTDPMAAGGFTAQVDTWYLGALAIASKTERVWNGISASDKAKHDLLALGIAVSSAYCSSSTNPQLAGWTPGKTGYAGVKAMRGQPDFPLTGLPNYSNAPYANLICASTYFGSGNTLTSMLNSFNLASFRTSLSSAGLRNMAQTFALTMSGAPTATQLVSSIKNYRGIKHTRDLSNLQTLWIDMANYVYSRTINAGLEPPIMVGGVRRGYIASNAAGLPNRGQVGMIYEFDGSDAEGLRSSAQYAMLGARATTIALAAMAASGQLNKSDVAFKTAAGKFSRAWIDLKYKTVNGYNDYSHAGKTGPNSDWRNTSAQDTRWGFKQNFGLADVLQQAVS